jgi:hypothetical protein
MPSKDRINPEANEWLAKEKPDAITLLERGATASRTGKRVVSAQVLRLARRLGKDPDEMARSMKPETLRKTKYPVIETVDADGKRHFKHDLGITEGVTSLLRK